MGAVIEVNLKPLADVADFLASRFVGREREIVACLAGLASGEPVFLCGPPGTVKTKLIDELAACINARVFRYTLHRETTTDELLGPFDIAALREGRLKRVTRGRLPEAEIVFLDEIFRGSSACRNALLDIILNKHFLDGTEYKPLPMLALYTASNDVSTDSEDAAFYDRLLIRCFCNYVPDSELDDLLLKGAELTFGDGSVPALQRPQVTADYIRRLQAFTRARALLIARDEAWRSKIIEAILELKSKGVILSDRRKVKLIHVFSAISTIFAEEEPTLDSLADALRLTAVHTEDDAPKVEEVIVKLNLSSVDLTRYNTTIEEAAKLLNDVMKTISETNSIRRDQLALLRTTRENLANLYKQMPKSLRAWAVRKRIKAVVDEIDKILNLFR